MQLIQSHSCNLPDNPLSFRSALPSLKYNQSHNEKGLQVVVHCAAVQISIVLWAVYKWNDMYTRNDGITLGNEQRHCKQCTEHRALQSESSVRTFSLTLEKIFHNL